MISEGMIGFHDWKYDQQACDWTYLGMIVRACNEGSLVARWQDLLKCFTNKFYILCY